MSLPKIKIGLALGGGAARAICHIGVLQVLQEHDIPVDLVAGTSGGSIIGALYAAGMKPETMVELVQRINWAHLVKFRLRRDGLLDASGLERMIELLVARKAFEDLDFPFSAVAADIVTGEGVVLNSGPIAPAVRASCAIPGIFLPVRLNRRLLVDGGIVENVPARVAREMGADLVIAVELTYPHRQPRPPRNVLHIIMYSLDIMQKSQRQQVETFADVIIRPDVGDLGFVEIDRWRDLLAAGRWAAEQAIPTIQGLIRERAS
ncbi:MAG: patatin-like phospholipase family protein [Actinobacteria bacterium]|nr:patatin-like phospholipase family protein [Actinomycetota bacterium]